MPMARNKAHSVGAHDILEHLLRAHPEEHNRLQPYVRRAQIYYNECGCAMSGAFLPRRRCLCRRLTSGGMTSSKANSPNFSHAQHSFLAPLSPASFSASPSPAFVSPFYIAIFAPNARSTEIGNVHMHQMGRYRRHLVQELEFKSRLRLHPLGRRRVEPVFAMGGRRLEPMHIVEPVPQVRPVELHRGLFLQGLLLGRQMDLQGFRLDHKIVCVLFSWVLKRVCVVWDTARCALLAFVKFRPSAAIRPSTIPVSSKTISIAAHRAWTALCIVAPG
jgi:hypothetical protein